VVDLASTHLPDQEVNGMFLTNNVSDSQKFNLQKMINGFQALILVEQKLELGTDIKEAMGENADILSH